MSLMEEEVNSISAVFRNFSALQKEAIEAIAAHLAIHPPRLLATIARGSSDHAAQFIRTVFEIELGIPTISVTPSIASIYRKQLVLKNCLTIAVSQSGFSPDLLAAVEMAKNGGAFVVAVVNNMSSPLADIADVVLPIEAGTEKAVAATKSFSGTLAIALRLLGRLSPNTVSATDMELLSDLWNQNADDSISDLGDILQARNCIVIGRGISLGIVQEAALKIKELLQYPAEAFSAAEVMHGPVGLASSSCSVLGWTTDNATTVSQQETLAHFRRLGSPILDLQHYFNSIIADNLHSFLRPVFPLPYFYRSLVQLAQRQGLDPDNPRNLLKVTRTR